jgi:hypothetical protein
MRGSSRETRKGKMMRKLLILLLVVGALAGLMAGSAMADPPGSPPLDCAGAVTSTAAGPGFGQVVAFFAAPPPPEQAIDNFGLAACGTNADERQNP